MGDILNLRRARKAKARAQAADIAAENRARFGRTRSQKQIDEAENERRDRGLDGKRLDRDA